MTVTATAEPLEQRITEESSRAPSRRLTTRLRILLAVVFLAVLAAPVAAGLQWRGQAADLRADTASAAAAEKAAVGAGRLLLSLSQATGPQTLAELKARATGDFAQQVDLLADTVSGVLQAGKVQSQGNVAASGVEKSSRSSATVLLAATALVSNSELPNGELRTFRMVAHMAKVGGTWKVSGMDFL